MREILALLGVSFTSALVPLVNIEVYLLGLSAVSSSDKVWLLAAVTGLGQMLGKMVWYYLGANALRWGWVRRKVEKPKAQAKLELWRSRTQDRPLLGATLLIVSAVTGFPPFAILSVLAGQLRMNAALFFGVGFAGRTLRFAAFLGGGGLLGGLTAGWL